MLKRSSKKPAVPSHIGDSLKSLFQGPLKAPNVSAEWKIWELWEQSVGTEISRQAVPKTFKNGILFVSARSALWASELQLRSHQIRMKLNTALGQELIREIHFRAGA
jgi:predicted nucleic acid-binding Zn ribbon protein